MALIVFLLAVLVSYAGAQFRGVPTAEQSPADSALLRVVSWLGVALLAAEGIDTWERLMTLVKRVMVAGTAVAALGIAQFATGSAIVPPLDLPGLSTDASVSALQVRSGLTRAAATASHPLEYAAVLSSALPLALALALHSERRPIPRWLPTVTVALAAVVAVSRSAIVGVVTGVALLAPTWSRRARLGAVLAGGGVLFAVFLLAPGVLGAVRGLFTGISGDPSTVSRTSAYDTAVGVAQHHLLAGRGLGTFLPQYWIFDNQYLQLLIEVGALGLAAFLALIGTAVIGSYGVRRIARRSADRQVCAALGASTASVAVLFAFFDALTFPMAAGLLFLLVGMCGAAARLIPTRAVHRPDGGTGGFVTDRSTLV